MGIDVGAGLEDPDSSKITFRLSRSLHQRFKSVQIYDGRSMEEVLQGMVARWVEKREQELKEEGTTGG